MENEESPAIVAANTSEGIRGWTESVFFTCSQTSVGQILLKLVERFLWVVEKSAQWSLPCQEIAAEENGKTFGKMELVRPLPWILFLPALVILRAIRGGLNVGAFILGYPQIQPSGVVKFVQKGRRRLRALNLKAVKNARRKNYNIKMTTPDEKSTTESAGSPIHTELKRKFSEVSSADDSTDESENETLQSKLDNAPLEESIHDPDYTPADCTTESSTGSSENEEGNLDVSVTEVEDVKRDAKTLYTDNKISLMLIPEHHDIPKEITEEQNSSAKQNDDETDRIADLRSGDEAEYHSPPNIGPYGDTRFYSPISSKSGSPERSISPDPEREDEPQRNNHRSTDYYSNGEVNVSPTNLGGASTEEVTNGVITEKRHMIPKFHHHRGKRPNHGYRKKK